MIDAKLFLKALSNLGNYELRRRWLLCFDGDYVNGIPSHWIMMMKEYGYISQEDMAYIIHK